MFSEPTVIDDTYVKMVQQFLEQQLQLIQNVIIDTAVFQ